MPLTRGRSVRFGGFLHRDSIEAAPSGAASNFTRGTRNERRRASLLTRSVSFARQTAGMNTAAATLDHIPSADGTLIACERSGSGPSLVIVNGALSDRRSVDGMRPHLDPHLTVVAYDRRGRGASGDAQRYAPEREMEDLAAVVAATGGNAFVFGHSSGAILALEAVLRGLTVQKLALNEPPFIVGSSRRGPSADLEERLRRLIDAGDREAALHLFLTDATGLDEAAISGMRSTPAWRRMLELANTAGYDAALTRGNEPPAAERLASILTPTLILNGDKTASWIQTSVAALTAAKSGRSAGGPRGPGPQPRARDPGEGVAGLLHRLTSPGASARPRSEKAPPLPD